MRVICNSIIPFKGFKCVNVFGVLFVRKEYKNKMSSFDYNHEAIHTAQMREMLFVFFYIAYALERLGRWIWMHDAYDAYRSLSFEREAYKHQNNLWYLENRESFSQFRKSKT